MIDFKINSNTLKDESRAIIFEYNKDGMAEIRKLYIKPINTTLALILSDIFDKINDLQEKINNDELNEQDKIKFIKEMYLLFKSFLKNVIINYEENQDLIEDLPIDENFIKTFIEKIQEKMIITDNKQKKNQSLRSRKRK